MSRNRVIGRDGGLPWHLSADLKRFKRLTMGHHIIMGRKTFESIGRPLPGRTSIVVTRQTEFAASGVLVAHNLNEALELAAGDDEAFIIGGAEVYRLALPHVDRIYLTEICADVRGDTTFPELDRGAWHLVDESHYDADDRNDFEHTFCILDRQTETMQSAARKGSAK